MTSLYVPLNEGGTLTDAKSRQKLTAFVKALLMYQAKTKLMLDFHLPCWFLHRMIADTRTVLLFFLCLARQTCGKASRNFTGSFLMLYQAGTWLSLWGWSLSGNGRRRKCRRVRLGDPLNVSLNEFQEPITLVFF